MAQKTAAQTLAAWLEHRSCGGITPNDLKAAAELRRLEAENTALRSCALKYLDFLCIPDQEKALAADLKDPKMLE